MKPIQYYTLLFMSCFVVCSTQVTASNTIQQIDSILTAKAAEIPALNEKVSISVSELSLDEFLRGVAKSSGLNLDVQPGLTHKVVNNFNAVVVKDILLYVCRLYDLELQFSGNIISVARKSDTPAVDKESVIWDEEKKLVTFDFRDTPVELAAKEITIRTGSNVILAPGLTDRRLNGYIASQPVKNALEKLAMSNSMKLESTEDGFMVLTAAELPQDNRASAEEERQDYNQSRSRRSQNTRSTQRNTNDEYSLEITMPTQDKYSIRAEDAPIESVLSELSEKTSFNYLISSKSEQRVTLKLEEVYIDALLNTLLKGSGMGFRVDNDVYLIGEKDFLEFSENKVIPLENRSVSELLESIPDVISSNLTLVEFPELNSIFVSGPAYQLQQFEDFVNDIDKVVPVVLIEVIIMYVNKTIGISTGLEAGLGEEPVATMGNLFPDLSLTIGSEGINKILDKPGLSKLGKVTPNFYVNLRAMEEQGLLDIESTPKLATLNGHEADLSIGNTEYYLEEQTHLYGTQNPQQTTSQEYKAVNAELSIKIKPIVSANEHITLEIEVHQSDFTERISATSPPGTVNRDFTSQIRVKDQEMILLGGLMEKRKDDSGSGTPILSRIPIIKWFFSSRSSKKSDSKLSVLIKPTIIN